MIIWNQSAQNILASFLQKIQQIQQIPFNFLLLEWPTNIGKTTLIYQFAKKLLWHYFQTDFLHIKDLSEILGKKHSIKIDNNEDIKLPNGNTYKDIWTRQMIEWLRMWSFGKYKILFLENINRMSIAAANSFLKTFEEPLNNRLIIATTPSKDLLLDTIVSRAFIINFHLVSFEEINQQINQFITNEEYQIWKDKWQIIYSLTWWKPWKLINMLNQINTDENILYEIETIERLINIIKSDNGLIEKLHILQEFEKNGKLNMILDTLLNFFQTHKQFDKLQTIVQTKYIIENTAVSKDNAMFYLAMKI